MICYFPTDFIFKKERFGMCEEKQLVGLTAHVVLVISSFPTASDRTRIKDGNWMGRNVGNAPLNALLISDYRQR